MDSVKLLSLAGAIFLDPLLVVACGGGAITPESATPPTIPVPNTVGAEPRPTPDTARVPTGDPTAALTPIAPLDPTSIPQTPVAAPSIELLDDRQTGEQRIRITSSTAGTSIRYTTAGNPPTVDEGIVYRDITIRDAPAVTVSIVVGSPWQDQTVDLDNLRRQLYEDKTWQIVDSTLRLHNVSTYGWEPNVYGTNNTLIIRDSDFSGSNLSGGANRVIVENSTMGAMATQQGVQMEIRGSTVKGDVIARDDSSITLIDTLVEAQELPGSDGDTVFGDVFAVDNATVTLVDSVVEGQTTTEGNGLIVIE